jgi:REP-associated tyrosine transposase
VHVVWQPNIGMPPILQWLKSVTAKGAKHLLDRKGKAFWQQESYDHWIRSDRELQKVLRYVERNPMKAGLTGTESRTTRSSAWSLDISTRKCS